jgi:uncharacterized protein DUF4325
MSKILNIVDVLNTQYPMSQEEAQVLYPILEKSILNGSPVTLSFKGVENCASIFLSTLLSRLYASYTTNVDKFIIIADIVPDENAIEDRIERIRKKALPPEVYFPIFEQA